VCKTFAHEVRGLSSLLRWQNTSLHLFCVSCYNSLICSFYQTVSSFKRKHFPGILIEGSLIKTAVHVTFYFKNRGPCVFNGPSLIVRFCEKCVSVLYCHDALVPVSIDLYVDNSNLQWSFLE
jgi:hypothetical protein